MKNILTLDDVDVKGKTVIVRVDFNSPIDVEEKKIIDSTRIKVHGKTTIKELAQRNAKVVVLAHQGRPGEPDFIPLKQHADVLSEVIKQPVQYVDDIFGEKARKNIMGLREGEVLVLENVRMYADELKKGSAQEHAKTALVQNLAPLADFFVNDAFAAAHRAHVSLIGFTSVLTSVAGRIMERELKALNRVLETPEKPCIYIIGGAKADDSLDISRYVLENNIADKVLTGGVVGHVFLVAKGHDLGDPNMQFIEKKGLLDLVPGIAKLMQRYPNQIETPVDVAIEVENERKEISIANLPTDSPIFDIGELTVKNFVNLIKAAKSIVVSGPLGVFENKKFSTGTEKVLQAVAESKAFSLIGGGHTVAAVEELGLADKMSYVSTAGGALIDFLMGKQLPGVISLHKRK